MSPDQIYAESFPHSHAQAVQAVYDQGFKDGVAAWLVASAAPAPAPTPTEVAAIPDQQQTAP